MIEQLADPLDFSPHPVTLVTDNKRKHKVHHTKDGITLCGSASYTGASWVAVDAAVTCKRCEQIWEKENPRAQLNLKP